MEIKPQIIDIVTHLLEQHTIFYNKIKTISDGKLICQEIAIMLYKNYIHIMKYHKLYELINILYNILEVYLLSLIKFQHTKLKYF